MKNNSLTNNAEKKDWTDTCVEICEGIGTVVFWCIRVILFFCFVGIAIEILHAIFGDSD